MASAGRGGGEMSRYEGACKRTILWGKKLIFSRNVCRVLVAYGCARGEVHMANSGRQSHLCCGLFFGHTTKPLLCAVLVHSKK